MMEELIGRFKEYLVSEFKRIRPTKQASEYRNRLLKQLVKTANEYKNNGIEDEAMLYQMSIDSLGDLRKTLEDLDKSSRRRATTIVGAVISLFLFATAVYLVASIISGAWSKTWLTYIYAAACALIPLGVYEIFRGIQRVEKLRIRLSLYWMTAAVFVAAYLSVLMFAPSFQYSWTLFLYMVIAMLGVDLVACLFLRAKSFWLILMAFIFFGTSLIYVALGVMRVVPWGTWWILPVIGIILDIAIGVALLCKYVIGHRYSEINKKYYTDWEE